MRTIRSFIELAALGKDDWLVTGDKDLLVMAGVFDRPVVTAQMLLARLDHAGAKDRSGLTTALDRKW